jgi:hypothetical protein
MATLASSRATLTIGTTPKTKPTRIVISTAEMTVLKAQPLAAALALWLVALLAF